MYVHEKIECLCGNARFVDVFGADLRSLAVLRILLALIVVVDLFGRSQNLVAHYTDQGVLPRRDLLQTLNQWRWSIEFMNGTTLFQQLVFGATFATAVAVVVGFRTRLMSVVLWILVTSIQVRNPLLLSGADSLLRILLFWCMFLPLGGRWSVDALLRRDVSPEPRSRATHVLSFATVAIFLQIAFVYWFTAILKDSAQWRSDGTAIYYALGARDLTTPLGNYLHQAGSILQLLTFGTLAIEILAPVLLFIPVFTGPFRTIGAALIVALHIGIVLTMNLGLFPWVSASCMVCFLPSWFWDVLLPRVRACLASWCPAWIRSGASPLPFPRLSADLLVWRRVAFARETTPERAGVGRQVAAASVSGAGRTLARPESGGAPRPQSPGRTILRAHPLANVACAFLIVFVFFWNVSTVSAFTVPSIANPVAYGLAIYQDWTMFAPRPQQSTIWYVMQGTLADGQHIDLLTPIVKNDMSISQSVVWDQSRGVLNENKYWRKYLSGISGNANEELWFAGYACRMWNGAHAGEEHVGTIAFYVVSARTLPDDKQAEPVPRQLGKYTCG